MGVPGLWDIIRPASEQRSIVHLSIHDGFLSDKHAKRGYRIGIDASIWYFHAHSSREGENPELRMLFFRLAKFLALPILPLFVFDGPKRPKIKRNKRIMGAQHPLTGNFKIMISAFGFEHHQAPGEAEAELAYLNRLEIIDAVLSDDVDNFLFGATLVMRNPSATLSGNKAHVMKNADGKQDDKHVLLFSSRRILEHPDIQLTHGGFVLIGLMSGGDYDTGGLSRCGIKISHGLARAGFGDSLIEAYTKNPPHALPVAIASWSASLCRYLATDPDKLIGRKNKALASSIPESFPLIDVLEAYLRPVTSESVGVVPDFSWAKQPSLKEIANLCELHYEWGVKPLIIKRFRTVIWGGALMRVLRAAVMQGDEKEARQTRGVDMGIPFTPKNGRRAADLAVGTPSKLITQCLSRLDLHSPRKLRDVDPFSNEYEPTADDEPLLVKIHSQRTHASTDGVLEYRVEIAPAQFVRMTEEGLLDLRSEDSIDIANFGKRKAQSDEDEGFGNVDDEGGKKGKEAAKPTDHMRIWVPACMLEMVQPSLVEDFEGIATAKEQKKWDKEQRAKEKAEGKVVPKKSRAVGAGSPSKSKAARVALLLATDDRQSEDQLPTQPAKTKETGPKKNFISDGSSDEDIGPTPRAKMAAHVRPLNLQSKLFGRSSSPTKNDSLSETGCMSTASVTERRLGKAAVSTQPLPMHSSRPPIPATAFPSKSATTSTGPSSSRATSASSVLRFPPIPNNPTSSKHLRSRHFMFTMKSDVSLDEVDSSGDEEALDPYAALAGVGVGVGATTSGNSRTSSGLVSTTRSVDMGKKLSGNGRIDMDFNEASPVRRPAQRSQDSVEDFSYLFPPSPSASKSKLPSERGTKAPTTSVKAAQTKRRNKFISTTDSSDEAPPVQKSPKKSKAQRSHPGPVPEKAVKAKAEKAVSPFPANEIKTATRKEPNTTRRVEEVIEISDSSGEEPTPPKPAKATVKTMDRGKARTVVSRTQSSKGKQDVSIIDLDD